MASRKRSPGQMALVEGMESWYMPAAGIRGKLEKIMQYTQFIDEPGDVAAARLIAEEAQESLAELREFVAGWQAFWSVIYCAEKMTAEEIVAVLKRLRTELEGQWTAR